MLIKVSVINSTNFSILYFCLKRPMRLDCSMTLSQNPELIFSSVRKVSQIPYLFLWADCSNKKRYYVLSCIIKIRFYLFFRTIYPWLLLKARGSKEKLLQCIFLVRKSNKKQAKLSLEPKLALKWKRYGPSKLGVS